MSLFYEPLYIKFHDTYGYTGTRIKLKTFYIRSNKNSNIFLMKVRNESEYRSVCNESPWQQTTSISLMTS